MFESNPGLIIDGRTVLIKWERSRPIEVGFMAAYYYSLAVLPMSDAVVLTYTSPVLTAVGATLLLGEVWHGLDFLGSGLCLAGVMMTTW